MKVNFDRTLKARKTDTVSIYQGAAYTALSCGKSRAKHELLNFNREHIKVNIAALNKMKRIREPAVFPWQHPIAEGSGNKIVLSYLRSWNDYIEQFITDIEITKYCDIICFTEANTHGSNFSEISNYLKYIFALNTELRFVFKSNL